MAQALAMNWVYYPAVIHPHHGRDFGNAILSRWPIERDRKIVLPHLSAFVRTQRIAVAASITIRGLPVSVYSIHLALPITVGARARREQAETVIADALCRGGHVIIAGDLNWHATGNSFAHAGFGWPTRNLGRTATVFDVDHIFVRGFSAASVPPVGIVRNNAGVSDHRPVWGLFTPERRPVPDPEVRRFARRDESIGIRRAAWIDSTLMRGGRPGSAGLVALKTFGFRTIVNFDRDDGEQREAARLGLDHFEIPLTAHLWSSPPREDQVRTFHELVSDPRRRPLFFHCRHGRDRTGMMAALHRIEVDGWTAIAAVREMQSFGYCDWYRDLIDFVMSYIPRGYPPTDGPNSRQMELP